MKKNNKKNNKKLLVLVQLLTLLLAGCATNQNKKTGDITKPSVEFKTLVQNDGNAVSDSHLKVGILSADPLTGIV